MNDGGILNTQSSEFHLCSKYCFGVCILSGRGIVHLVRDHSVPQYYYHVDLILVNNRSLYFWTEWCTTYTFLPNELYIMGEIWSSVRSCQETFTETKMVNLYRSMLEKLIPHTTCYFTTTQLVIALPGINTVGVHRTWVHHNDTLLSGIK